MNFPKSDYNSLVAFYGNIGENQTLMELPFPMRLAWNKSKTLTKITCHQKISGSLHKCLSDIYNHYNKDLQKIQSLNLDLFGGCFNVRKMGISDQWSTHSWGIAIDIDPFYNLLRWNRSQAKNAGCSNTNLY